MKYNILLTFNNNYVKNVKPLIRSIVNNVENTECDIFLLNNDITNKNYKKIKKIVKNCMKINQSINVINVKFPIEIIKDLPIQIGENRWSIEIYFRIFAPFILKNIDRCLYLDADVIVAKKISEFYNQSFENNCLVAVRNDIQEKHKNRLHLNEKNVYFNSGIILMNCKMIRNDYNLECIRRKLYQIKKVLEYPDQDFLNLFFEGKIKEAEKEYNYMISVQEIRTNYSQVYDYVFCHYVLTKPWKILFPYKSDKEYLKNVFPITKRIILWAIHRMYRFYKLYINVDRRLKGDR